MGRDPTSTQPPLTFAEDDGYPAPSAYRPQVFGCRGGLSNVSKRLRNSQFHPVWDFIADQAWVR